MNNTVIPADALNRFRHAASQFAGSVAPRASRLLILKDDIAALFDGKVDVVNRDGLKPYVKPAATADAIYAF